MCILFYSELKFHPTSRTSKIIHSLYKHLLNIYYVFSSVLGVGDNINPQFEGVDSQSYKQVQLMRWVLNWVKYRSKQYCHPESPLISVALSSLTGTARKSNY